MIPFYEFFQWLKRASKGERASAGVATVILIALLVWVIVPIGNGSSSPAGAQAAGTTTKNAAGQSCTNPAGAVNGVTATTVKIAIIITNVTGIANNASLGIAPAAEAKADYAALVNNINASGGIDCRKIVPVYFNGNPADQSSLQQTCLSVVQAKVFAVVDSGAFAAFPIVDCFPEHQVPYFGGYILPQSQLEKFYPYLFEFNNTDSLYQTTITALNAQGFFSASKGFRKLGLIYQDCNPQHYAEVRALLAQYQVPASSIVTFDVGCPNPFTPATVLQQAVLKFKNAGVTNVTTIGFRGDFATFTKLAQVQKFTPRYGLPDDQVVTGTYGTSGPSFPNIANALTVAENRDGEDTTPGYQPSAGTIACDKIFTAAGQKSTYKGGSGNACSQMWELKAAVDNEPALSQTELPAGLAAAKSVDFAFPQGPNDFSAGHTTWGGQYYRVLQFHTSCNCWQLLTTSFAKSDALSVGPTPSPVPTS